MKHIYISGRVQGVGYRQFVKYNAVKLNIKGWVKNLSDGRVEIIVSGDEGDVKKLIQKLERGTYLSEVTNIEIGEVEEMNFIEFKIVKE